MIVKTTKEFRQAIMVNQYPIKQAAVMKAAFMVAPIGFALDEQTAKDNKYMQMEQATDANLAIVQQMELARKISDCGVPVVTFPGSFATPDAVFPNNAFATAHGHKYIIGAMLHANRQQETLRSDIIMFFDDMLGYSKYHIPRDNCVAELTGVLVPDRGRNIAFCGMTERVNNAGAQAMHDAFALDLMFQFDLAAGEYHTNVVLSCLAGRACMLHAGSFADPEVPQAIAEFYQGRTIFLTDAEKLAFAGNGITITENDLFLSQTAYDVLAAESKDQLTSWGFKLHHVQVSELEKAGGSLRCMVGEIF
ncbi:MAG: arginine deiminase-related protein [Proteobacteria bacterium]|nr:arginine deiminase-related protein [Pseudomonadota bacterium]